MKNKKYASARSINRPSARRSIADRRGAVLVETILVLPILLIFLLGVIVFGQALGNLQQIALASRVGAEAASETISLPTNNNDEVPANIITAINQQLGSSGMTACRVTLEHNNTGGGSLSTPITLTSGECECATPETSLPPRRGYVRVTVCVRATDVAPNLLCSLGLDFGGKTFVHTTTFRYEF